MCIVPISIGYIASVAFARCDAVSFELEMGKCRAHDVHFVQAVQSGAVEMDEAWFVH